MAGRLTVSKIEKYIGYLRREERTEATIAKYAHDLRCFAEAVKGQPVKKETVTAYKNRLLLTHAPSSVNAALAAINGLLAWLGWHECRVRPVRVQQSVYRESERELSRTEYLRLLETARQQGKEQLYGIIQTICATGIRVSELRFVTVEAVNRGIMQVRNKGKCRSVFLCRALQRWLRGYCRKKNILSGPVFVTRKGNCVNRSNIWSMMKALCQAAQVARSKVFPHNLRHLFARTFYQQERDLEHLACILGHSNINTTRIYTRTTGAEHRRQIDRMRLVI